MPPTPLENLALELAAIRQALMTVPLQPSTHSRLCVVCWSTRTQREATAHTPIRGYAVCDHHSSMDETAIRLTTQR